MVWTSPRTWVAAETVTASNMNTHVRDNFKAIGDAWASYTPTLSNWTLVNGTLTGKVMQAGKLVHFRVSYTVGSSDTKSGNLVISLPVAQTTSGGPINGHAELFDTSAASRVQRLPAGSGTSNIVLVDLGHTAASATVPWTWATGDTVEINGSYEAA